MPCILTISTLTGDMCLKAGINIHLNPVKARMVTHPEEYLWSSYQTVIGIADDRITEKEKTLAYFSKNSVFYYREFVEDIGYKYIVQEQHIRKMIGEEELWLPW